VADTPLDLGWERKARFHCRVRGISADEQVIDVVAKTIAPLLAEVETLRTRIAEQDLEATKRATEGEWVTEYGNRHTEGAPVTWHAMPYGAWTREVWRGPARANPDYRWPVQAVEETTE